MIAPAAIIPAATIPHDVRSIASLGAAAPVRTATLLVLLVVLFAVVELELVEAALVVTLIRMNE